MAAAIGWFLLLFAGIGVFAIVALAGDAVCASPRYGDSNYGRMTWSVLPPGHRCTYTRELNGYDDKPGPSLYPSAYLLVLVVSGALVLRVARQTRGRLPAL